jgi:hypothetical protein
MENKRIKTSKKYGVTLALWENTVNGAAYITRRSRGGFIDKMVYTSKKDKKETSEHFDKMAAQLTRKRGE